MKSFTRIRHCLLAVACATAGLLLLHAGEPLQGGRFRLTGTPTGGGGRAVGGPHEVRGVIGQAATAVSSGGSFRLSGGLLGVVVVPGDVLITVEATEDGRARLTWPSTVTGLQLEFAPQLGPATEWRPVEPAPTGNEFLTPMNQPLRFFRLRGP